MSILKSLKSDIIKLVETERKIGQLLTELQFITNMKDKRNYNPDRASLILIEIDKLAGLSYNLKLELGTGTMKIDIANYADKEFYVFGSETSIDTDVVVLVDELPSIETCKQVSYYFKNTLSYNLNLCVVKDGIVIDCHKGSPDEMNNSLFQTFRHHKENEGKTNPVTRMVERNVPLKVIRCSRICLSLLSKSQYRPEIKKALVSHDFNERMKVLSEINFNNISEDVLTKDVLKSIAFQMGQTLALMYGHEFYTKKDVAKYCPELAPFLNRIDLDDRQYYFQGLNEIRKELLSCFDFIESNKINQTVNNFLVKYDMLNYFNPEDKLYNFYNQFINTTIDLKTEKIVNNL